MKEKLLQALNQNNGKLLCTQEELAALADINTWSLSELPHGSKYIGSKWVFDIKQSVDGEIVRYKSSLVAKGYAQLPGMDYDEVFAPVAKHATIRYILSMAATMNKTAFY